MIPKEAFGRQSARLPEPQLHRRDTALLIVDMQYEDAHPDYGVCARLRARGETHVLTQYLERLAIVIPKIQRLIDTFRAREMEVIYTRIESLTENGRDRSWEHKQLDIHVPPGSKEAEILAELAPRRDDIVLSKTCGSVFNGSMIDYVLRNIGVRNLVVVGVVTGGCIESTIRDAADLSYSVVLVEDCTATWTREKHEAAIAAATETFAKIKTTDEVVDALSAL